MQAVTESKLLFPALIATCDNKVGRKLEAAAKPPDEDPQAGIRYESESPYFPCALAKDANAISARIPPSRNHYSQQVPLGSHKAQELLHEGVIRVALPANVTF